MISCLILKEEGKYSAVFFNWIKKKKSNHSIFHSGSLDDCYGWGAGIQWLHSRLSTNFNADLGLNLIDFSHFTVKLWNQTKARLSLTYIRKPVKRGVFSATSLVILLLSQIVWILSFVAVTGNNGFWESELRNKETVCFHGML